MSGHLTRSVQFKLRLKAQYRCFGLVHSQRAGTVSPQYPHIKGESIALAQRISCNLRFIPCRMEACQQRFLAPIHRGLPNALQEHSQMHGQYPQTTLDRSRQCHIPRSPAKTFKGAVQAKRVLVARHGNHAFYPGGDALRPVNNATLTRLFPPARRNAAGTRTPQRARGTPAPRKRRQARSIWSQIRFPVLEAA